MVDISVIIPMYNSENYIYKCIKSVLCQTLKSIEIIIVNDGSTDNSIQELEKFDDKRIKLINIEHRRSGSCKKHCD